MNTVNSRDGNELNMQNHLTHNDDAKRKGGENNDNKLGIMVGKTTMNNKYI